MEISRLTRDGTAEPVSRNQILRRERGQGNIFFPCSADQVQDWQPYPIDPYSYYMCDYTYMQATEWHDYLTPLFSHIYFPVHAINGRISEAGTSVKYVVLRLLSY